MGCNEFLLNDSHSSDGVGVVNSGVGLDGRR